MLRLLGVGSKTKNWVDCNTLALVSSPVGGCAGGRGWTVGPVDVSEDVGSEIRTLLCDLTEGSHEEDGGPIPNSTRVSFVCVCGFLLPVPSTFHHNIIQVIATPRAC